MEMMKLLKLSDGQLYKTAWLIYLLFLLIYLINLGFLLSEGLMTRSLPFTLEEGRIRKFRDESYRDLLKNKTITAVDSFLTFTEVEGEERQIERSGLNINIEEDAEGLIFFQNLLYPQIINGKEIVEITTRDTLSGEVEQYDIKTYRIIDIIKLVELFFYLFLTIFAFSNSYIILRYSRMKENLLVALFLLLLFLPKASYLLSPQIQNIWSGLISPFWGIVFYHFIVIKTGVSKKVKRLYIISGIIFLITYLLKLIELNITLFNVWSIFWLIKGFILLRKQYRKEKGIQLKRLLAAFGGIGFSLICILIFFALVLLLSIIVGIGSITGLIRLLEMQQIMVVIIGIVFLLPFIGFILGILWFFGSFSWSLLTGTALDVKIRSTLIYSLVGFIFIIMFGLVDYSLGEILQSLFGRFFGSEFIAGIPATIGLLLFFNPVRNYAEKIVDRKLNSSDLDFLEKAETFSRDISEEGIIEGFEEYICENLIAKLEVTKVAIVSFDIELGYYKFNEIRGSDVKENSPIKDSENKLKNEALIRISNPVKSIQDISSFNLIFRLLYEAKHKWFLLLGNKNDGSLYNKRDLVALQNLIEKIRLSLKFILTYEDITREKYEKVISQKNKTIKNKDEIITQLKTTLSSVSKNVDPEI